jgi:hypothetical protein
MGKKRTGFVCLAIAVIASVVIAINPLCEPGGVGVAVNPLCEPGGVEIAVNPLFEPGGVQTA